MIEEGTYGRIGRPRPVHHCGVVNRNNTRWQRGLPQHKEACLSSSGLSSRECDCVIEGGGG